MTFNIGLNDKDLTTIVAKLKNILADSMGLYAVTQTVHWNVTGPLFQSVHAMTEEEYLELATAIDDVAERIRALNAKVPADISSFKSGSLPSVDENAPAEDMVKTLVGLHEALSRNLRSAVALAADAGDEVTAGLLTDRLTVHEKTAWMLRALIA